MKRLIIILLITLCLSASVTACNLSLAADVTPPPDYEEKPELQVSPTGKVVTSSYPLVPANPNEGKAIYIEKCAPCHGINGLGNGSRASQLPNPVTPIGTPEIARLKSPLEWYMIVTKGNLERFMPPFESLSDRQRWDVVAYAYSLSADPALIAHGKVLYQENCAGCHGFEGKGNGEQAGSLEVQPPDFTSQQFMANRTTSEFFMALTDGKQPVMASYKEQFNETERWAIADYLRTLSFAPYQVQTADQAVPAAQSTPSSGSSATPETTQDQEFSPEIALGTITGVVSKQTGEEINETLEITLHGFDSMTPVITTTTTLNNEDSTFLFEGIEMPAGRIFFTSTDYQGMTYASDVIELAQEGGEISLPIQIFDTTTDPSALIVERLHYFFELTDQQTLRVVELYVISNPSSETLISEEEGGEVIHFSLPAGAQNLNFQDGILGGRYIKTEDGFADTLPIRPGIGEYEVIFSYELPYDGKIEFNHPVNLSTKAVVILLPEDGIKLKGKGIQDAGSRDIQGVPFRMYNGSSLNSGDEQNLTISGGVSSLNIFSNLQTNPNFLVGLGIFGIVFIFAGLWLVLRYRKQTNKGTQDKEAAFEMEKPTDEDAESIMDAILALDDLYRQGDLPDEAYQKRRDELKEKLKGLVKIGTTEEADDRGNNAG